MVYRHFHCYDPQHAQYAEIDVLGVGHDGFVIVEVKSYKSRWESLDFHSQPMWRREGGQAKFKSPVWQVRRARLALINSIHQAYPSKAKVLDSCRTYVFLDRGVVANAAQPEVAKVWSAMKIQVLPLSQRGVLPTASAPASASFIAWLDAYRRYFRWRWHYKLLWKLRLLDSQLRKLGQRWASQSKPVL